MSRQILFLTPEPPYPLRGGGAFRIASLLHYFARDADVDLVLLSDSGQPALLPQGLVRSQMVIPLPPSSRHLFFRYLRNARRAVRGVPPLIDRLGGLENLIASAVQGRRFDVGILEHFWCAPYVDLLRQHCGASILDLHNVESSLHARCARVDRGLQQAGQRRFAAVSRSLESKLLPRFDLVLTASEHDAAKALAIAPGAKVDVYPNALPAIETPRATEQADRVVFSGNFEYHPNIDAVGWFVQSIWPLVEQKNPAARLVLVGRGEQFVKHWIAKRRSIESTGSVDDALVEIARSAVVVAPLRAGSGTRIKILEGWAAARPVIATSLAAEGLEANDGQNILLRDVPEQFAASLLMLLKDTGERRRLGSAGRATFESRYTWETAWKTLDRSLQVSSSTVLGSYTK